MHLQTACVVALLGVLLLSVAVPAAALGHAVVSPESGVSGVYGTWTVTYTVGPGGIARGGGVRVQLPDTWHAGPRNSGNRLQALWPEEEHYVTAHASRDGVRVRTEVEAFSGNPLIKHGKDSLDGRNERYVYVVRATIEAGQLEPGDSLAVVYGDTRGGGPGYRAGAALGGTEPVLIAVDASGDGAYAMLPDPPGLTLRGGRPHELQLHAPTTAALDASHRFTVALVDAESNPAGQGDTLSLRVVEGAATLPDSVEITGATGYAEFTATPTAAGTLRIEAVSDRWVLNATSNPVVVHADMPEAAIYWGDLHSHTRYSWDGVGDFPFDYARHVAGLDFYAMTDHSRTPDKGRTRGLGPHVWDEYTARTEAANDPGRFVALHGYECSFGRPYGHHNVYFRGGPGALIAPESHSLPQLWDALVRGEALTIPHHTGKFPKGVDFSIHDPDFRRNFELYSGHGLSEVYAPLQPLAFEFSDFTSPARSLEAGSYLQDAWRMGLELSAIAASDDHRAQPGKPHYGLTAVYAPELTREAIFQALYDRRTYATTGQKIVLDFQVNGTPMGQQGKSSPAPEVRIHAIGTGAIARVEVLRLNAGHDAFEVVQTWTPDTRAFNTTWTDETFNGPGIYYMRLRQARPVRNLPVMAWSSPVWLR